MEREETIGSCYNQSISLYDIELRLKPALYIGCSFSASTGTGVSTGRMEWFVNALARMARHEWMTTHKRTLKCPLLRGVGIYKEGQPGRGETDDD